MEEKPIFIENLDEIDKSVRDKCRKYLPDNFTFYENLHFFDECNNDIDENEKYYAYMLYCWDFLHSTYLSAKFDNFESLPVTKKTLMDNVINYNKWLLESHTHLFLYYVVLAAEEFIATNDSLVVYGNRGVLLSLIGKIEALMSSIDIIALKIYGDHSITLSSIPYSLTRGREKIELSHFTRTMAEAENKFDSIISDSRWADINTFLKEQSLLSDKLEEQKELIGTVDNLNNRLDNAKSEYNFLNLTQAFTNIRKIKKEELKKVDRIFILIGLALLLTPASLLFFNIFGDTSKFIGLDKLLYILPVATIEVILLYFIRIYYVQKNSVTAQLLQIDFRLSICEFIKNYVDDRTINEKDQSTWSAFEALIFSPIQSRDDKIPSVLDGSESIADFINKILNAKKASQS